MVFPKRGKQMKSLKVLSTIPSSVPQFCETFLKVVKISKIKLTVNIHFGTQFKICGNVSPFAAAGNTGINKTFDNSENIPTSVHWFLGNCLTVRVLGGVGEEKRERRKVFSSEPEFYLGIIVVIHSSWKSMEFKIFIWFKVISAWLQMLERMV